MWNLLIKHSLLEYYFFFRLLLGFFVSGARPTGVVGLYVKAIPVGYNLKL